MHPVGHLSEIRHRILRSGVALETSELDLSRLEFHTNIRSLSTGTKCGLDLIRLTGGVSRPPACWALPKKPPSTAMGVGYTLSRITTQSQEEA